MSLIRKFIFGIIGSCGCLYLVNQICGPFLYQNLTASAPIGLYRRSYDTPQIGDYVICRLPDQIKGLIKDDNTLLIKKFIASQGADYEVELNKFMVNGIKYPIYELKKLPRLQTGKFKVPQNQALVMNDSPISFDSRYFGPVNKDNIIGKIDLMIDYDKVVDYWKRW